VSPERLLGLEGASRSCRWNLDARVKLLVSLCFAISAVAIPFGAWGLFTLHAIMLVCMIALSGVPVGMVLSRLSVVLPLLLLIAVSTLFMVRAETVPDGGLFISSISSTPLARVGSITLRALCAVTSIVLLTTTTPSRDLLKAVEQLRFPRLLVMVASMTWRYMIVLMEEARSIRRAVVSRGFRANWIWQAGTIGRMIGALFLRSVERSERVHQAMLSRFAFMGKSRAKSEPVPLRDGLFLVSTVMILLTPRVLF